jgi:hypothetical protein
MHTMARCGPYVLAQGFEGCIVDVFCQISDGQTDGRHKKERRLQLRLLLLDGILALYQVTLGHVFGGI